MSQEREDYSQQRVFVGRNPTDAKYVHGLLESAGIEAELRNAHLWVAHGEFGIGPDTSPSVWVFASDVAQAEELLKGLWEETPTLAVWICPKCGESLEAQFTDCWSCGAPRPQSQ